MLITFFLHNFVNTTLWMVCSTTSVREAREHNDGMRMERHSHEPRVYGCRVSRQTLLTLSRQSRYMSLKTRYICRAHRGCDISCTILRSFSLQHVREHRADVRRGLPLLTITASQSTSRNYASLRLAASRPGSRRCTKQKVPADTTFYREGFCQRVTI